MQILRVLNNNSVVTVNEKKQEIIITGAGIGFKKKKGDSIDQSLVDKIYCLQNKEQNQKLQRIVQEMSEKYLNITGKVVDAARNKYQLKVNDILYVTLTDHINSVIERHFAGIHLKNMLKMDIQKFYPKEYDLGKKALQWIFEETDIQLLDDEAAFIAMHIVSSELENSETPNVKKIVELMNSIVQIVRIHFKITFDEDSTAYQRFITHLKFFSSKVFSGKVYKDSMQEIYDIMVKQNPKAYTCVEKIATLIQKQYGYAIGVDEQLYLLIHIKRILDEQ